MAAGPGVQSWRGSLAAPAWARFDSERRQLRQFRAECVRRALAAGWAEGLGSGTLEALAGPGSAGLGSGTLRAMAEESSAGAGSAIVAAGDGPPCDERSGGRPVAPPRRCDRCRAREGAPAGAWRACTACGHGGGRHLLGCPGQDWHDCDAVARGRFSTARVRLPTAAELVGMRGLTLRQPWLWSITDLPAADRKDVENRPRRLPLPLVGAWLALHAGHVYDDAGAVKINVLTGEFPPPEGSDSLHCGSIVALVRLDGFGHVSDFDGLNLTRWMFGPWCYLLEDLLVLAEPVSARGMQGFWPVPQPQREQIAAQVEALRAP